MENKLLIIVIGIAILLVGGYLLYSDIDKNAPLVSAQGQYSMKFLPDEASVYLNAQGKGNTAEDAKNKQVNISNNLVSALHSLGIADKDIQTSNFNVYPEYSYDNGRSDIIGYTASQQIEVKTSEFSRIASIIDKSVDAGALVNYINFELSQDKENEYKTKVIEEAGKDAKLKAEAIAAGQGKKLGRLVSIQPQDYYSPGPYRYFDAASSASGGIALDKAVANINPTELEVSSSVIVQYKLSNF